MRVMIPFKNAKTGEIRKVKLGFSWTLLFFSQFALPLFLRQLNRLGVLMLTFILVNMLAHHSDSDIAVFIQLLSGIPSLVLDIWLAFTGNKLTAVNYLKSGWEFLEPESEFTKIAKQKWGIANNSLKNMPAPKAEDVQREVKAQKSYLEKYVDSVASNVLKGRYIFYLAGSLVGISLMFYIVLIISDNLPSLRRLFQGQQSAEEITLPACDSSDTEGALIRTLEFSPEGMAAKVTVFSVKDQEQTNYVQDMRRSCFAHVYTDTWDKIIVFHLTWLNKKEGKYFLEIANQ